MPAGLRQTCLSQNGFGRMYICICMHVNGPSPFLFFVFSPAVLLQTMIVIIIDMFVGMKAVGESELTMFVKKHSLSFTWSFSLNCSCSRSISASVRIGGTGRKALECYNTIIL